MNRENRNLASLILCVLLWSVSGVAQAPTSTAGPAPAQERPKFSLPPITPEQRAAYQKAEQEKLLKDWPDLARYRDADAAVTPPAPKEDRVVFMGDSITEGWGRKGNAFMPDGGEFFPGKPYINRGISGQTTPQMLVRFRQDVIALNPKVAVILAGANDIAGNTGETTLAAIEDNLVSMSDLARANGIRVVLASVLPCLDFWWRPGQQPAEKIKALNDWIRDYAAKHGIPYVDYYSAMVSDKQGMRDDLSFDGVHPNKAGYDIMAPLAEAGIAAAIKRGSVNSPE
jgi:lysophospholipase L1-like esterase